MKKKTLLPYTYVRILEYWKDRITFRKISLGLVKEEHRIKYAKKNLNIYFFFCFNSKTIN